MRVKALLRDRDRSRKPTCFISYAWGVPEHERWVLQMAKDLRNAGIDVLLDRWHSPPGSNLDLYLERIISSDFVIPVGTPQLREKYDTRTGDPVVAAELRLVDLRINLRSMVKPFYPCCLMVPRHIFHTVITNAGLYRLQSNTLVMCVYLVQFAYCCARARLAHPRSRRTSRNVFLMSTSPALHWHARPVAQGHISTRSITACSGWPRWMRCGSGDWR